MKQIGLATPEGQDGDWRSNAKCRGRKISDFFVNDSARGRSRARQEAVAKAVCGACTVRIECLQDSLVHRDACGIFGGFTYVERELLRTVDSMPVDIPTAESALRTAVARNLAAKAMKGVEVQMQPAEVAEAV